ncbi:LCP family protein [Streptomyces pactum]|uniref:LCP family protein n=1 Tax=Streptomyces pactum TaxID=68249 RepID=A0ABS0NN95_9ACTN|nr:LCP family protein [Streptomyces pactum]MBH5336648.1 LCP family protein [Streptomyces pactum]
MEQERRARGEGRRRRAPEAREQGRDDSPYEGPEAAGGPAGAGRGAAADASGAAAGSPAGTGDAPASTRAERRAAQRSGKSPVPAPRNGGRGRRRPPAGKGGGKGGRRSKGIRILKWSALALAVLILGAAGAGYLYYQHLNNNLKKETLNLGKNKLDRAAPNADGETPLNILLLGSDSRNSAENLKLGGARDTVGEKPRADVQMLVHVSADRSNMSVITIPRDTRVKIPECVDEDGTVYPETDSKIINASMQHGGPGCTVATWEDLTGIPIDHFMKIEFSGVVDMADAVGGVPVCVQANVYDKSSGLRLERGETYVKGRQALQWLRTRHGFAGQSDLARAKAQHMYMSAMVRQLKKNAKLSDPGKLMDLADAATKALTVDPDLNVKKLYDLGNELKQVPTKRITMTTMPWVPDPRDPDAHVIPHPEDAEKLFSLVRNDVALDGKDKKKPKKKPAPKPSTAVNELPVTVQNGTGTTTLGPVPQRAAVLADVLVQAGYAQAKADATPRSQVDTTIAYPSEKLHGDALAVAKALGLPKKAVRHSVAVTQVTLVVGSDWREGTAYPKSAGKDEEEDKTPSTADLLNGGDEKACMPVDQGHTF